MKPHESWTEALGTSPFLQSRFTDKLKQQIVEKSKNRPRKRLRFAGLTATAAIVLLVCAGVWIANSVNVNTPEPGTASPDAAQAENVRTEYVEDGKLLFQVFPAPGLTAGVRQGYMIRFLEPFDVFSGKKLTIDAFQPEANAQLAAVSETISNPSPGYGSLERFTASFDLPLAGRWKYQVKLDGKFYGDFVLDVADPAVWTPSPTFDLPLGNGQKYVLLGEKGKVGFLVGPYSNEKGELLEQMPFVAGKMNKYMWHFWGSKEELSGNFSVLAVKEGARREIGIFSAFSLGGALNGADAAIPSSMELPDPGMWRLNAYIGDRLFGSIYVKVEGPR